MSNSEVSSLGQTRQFAKISTGGAGAEGGKRPHQSKLWGQMSRLHFQLGGECPLIDLLNGVGGGGGGKCLWAYVLESCHQPSLK